MIESTLKGYKFSNGPNLVVVRNLKVQPAEIIDSLAGNDVIRGKSKTDNGIIIKKDGTILTSSGDDLVKGLSLVDSGRGPDDRGHGIHNLVGGVIDTGSGNDNVYGMGSSRGRAGILTSGLIETGAGDDVITGLGTLSSGIRVDSGGTLKTGKGNDTITGSSPNDQFGSAISVQGGNITMGAGNDLLDVKGGGIDGSGIIDLGKGDDTFSGFVHLGKVQIDGGKGSDLLALPNRSFVVTIFKGIVSFTNGNRVLEASSFERVSLGGQNFSIPDLINEQVLSV
jgi:Ca2+-binding RTX toxin-like protein